MILCSRCVKQPAVMEIDQSHLCGDCYRKKTGRCPVCMRIGCTHYDDKKE